MNIQLIPMAECDILQFKHDIQEAFQKGFEDEFGETEQTVLPEKDIDKSLSAKGATSYKAMIDGEMVGGAVVSIDTKTQHNHLELLYVKYETQSKGIGKAIWNTIEELYPETKVWKTCTPYFEKRNIHFYVNVCGFHITEFWCEKNPMPECPKDFIGDGNKGMFGFEKVIFER